MKILGNIIACLLLQPAMVLALDMEHYDRPGLNINLKICQTGRQKALKQRGEEVTGVKDDLIRRTVRAHGGDYVRKGEMAAIMLNGKTYTDFIIEVVDGKYLFIKTSYDIFYLDVVDK